MVFEYDKVKFLVIVNLVVYEYLHCKFQFLLDVLLSFCSVYRLTHILILGYLCDESFVSLVLVLFNGSTEYYLIYLRVATFTNIYNVNMR